MSRSLVIMKKVCEWCGNEFEAQRKGTKYCSHLCNSRAYKANTRLNVKASIEKETQEIIKNKPIENFKDNEFLKCAQAAVLLGVCKQTIYNLIYTKQLKAVRLSSRLTVIKRSDIDNLLQMAEPFEKQQKQKPELKPITDFYKLSEITIKYGIKTRRIWAIIARLNIPTKKIGKFTHVSQKHIDKYFSKKNIAPLYANENGAKTSQVREEIAQYYPRVITNHNYLTN